MPPRRSFGNAQRARCLVVGQPGEDRRSRCGERALVLFETEAQDLRRSDETPQNSFCAVREELCGALSRGVRVVECSWKRGTRSGKKGDLRAMRSAIQ